jgi:hypothetical protein
VPLGSLGLPHAPFASGTGQKPRIASLTLSKRGFRLTADTAKRILPRVSLSTTRGHTSGSERRSRKSPARSVRVTKLRQPFTLLNASYLVGAFSAHSRGWPWPFAVQCAVGPLDHLMRPYSIALALPYPDTLNVGQNVRISSMQNSAHVTAQRLKRLLWKRAQRCEDCGRPARGSRCLRHQRLNAQRQAAYRLRIAKLPWQWV